MLARDEARFSYGWVLITSHFAITDYDRIPDVNFAPASVGGIGTACAGVMHYGARLRPPLGLCLRGHGGFNQFKVGAQEVNVPRRKTRAEKADFDFHVVP